MSNSRCISFTLGGMFFEYDEEKNKKNIEKHGISFKSAARIFFDYDRIEFYDEENSIEEDRYDTIGNLSAGQSVMFSKQDTLIGSITKEDVLFVVYTERVKKLVNGDEIEVTRLISARYATSFERGLYYGKY
ncbi:MAG: BrnT family toxin [Lachnobacterium sp.]|nr:BrnT family toxin [Lachnobacterium sp.]